MNISEEQHPSIECKFLGNKNHKLAVGVLISTEKTPPPRPEDASGSPLPLARQRQPKWRRRHQHLKQQQHRYSQGNNPRAIVTAQKHFNGNYFPIDEGIFSGKSTVAQKDDAFRRELQQNDAYLLKRITDSDRIFRDGIARKKTTAMIETSLVDSLMD